MEPRTVPGLTEVADGFDAVGYRLQPMRALLGIAGDLGVGPGERATHERRLAANPGPLADLVALLALGRPTPTARISAALGPTALAALVTAGALTEAGTEVVPTITLLPHGELWIGADLPPAAGLAEGPLHVIGVHPPTTLLAALTVRRDVKTALDLGTGNGYQALLMASHADRVVATDVNPRALSFASFNAALNGIDNIEFRDGGLFEPVAGERFDLIASNPPYVISPETDLVYRDSGREPGAMCAQFVAEVASYLTADGFATLLASWPIAAGAEWSVAPTSWVGDDVRAWVVQISVADVLAHAAQWNQPLVVGGDTASYGAAVDRWVDYANGRGIDRIGYGAIFLQPARDVGGVIRADELSAGRGSASSHVERVFAADHQLASLRIDAVADLRCALPTEHRVNREVHNAGGWRQVSTTLTLAEGLGVEITLDPVMAEIVLQMTNGLTVTEAVEVACEVGRIPVEEREDLLLAAVMTARELISLGIVTTV